MERKRKITVARRFAHAGMSWVFAGVLVLSLGCEGEQAAVLSRSLEVGGFANHSIVIVSVDTLRADHLGLYGYERDTSPTLDRLARDAVTFERARAPRGLTWPSLVSMFTSLYPKSSNVRQNGDLLADDVPTLASLLEARGYATAAFRGNACATFTKNFGTNFCGSDEDVHRKALDWISAHDGSPFLLWVHYMAPHEEYLPPEKYDRFTDAAYRGAANGTRSYLDGVILSGKAPEAEDLEHVIGLYDGEILYADTMLGEVVEALERQGLFDDSLFVFTSDHGEELLQHNNYYYHACSVYDAVLHIPLVIRFPNRSHAGQRVRQLVENIDIAPTLLELLGVARPSGFEGQSMRELVNGAPGAADRFTHAFAEYNRPDTGWVGTVRTDRWHYVHNPDRITPQCRPRSDYFSVAARELYDHSSDPGESDNVADEHRDLIDELSRELVAVFDEQRDHASPLRADPQVIEQLKAVGYLVE